MPTSKTYTESIAVRLPTPIAEDIEEALGDVGLSAGLRDATLRAIGRPDLVLDDTRSESPRKSSRRPDTQWVVTPVKMTKTQRVAIERAAKSKSIATSALMLNALRAELELPPREPVARRRGKTMRSTVRAIARKVAPSLKLPVERGTDVSLSVRRRIAERAGVSLETVTKALQTDPNRVGWQLGRRRSSPPTKR